MRLRAAAVTMLLMIAACAGNVDPARQIDDAVIAERVRTALASDTGVASENIDVSVTRGQVRLTGTVSRVEARTRAEDVARGIAGVTGVENLLSSP